MDYTAYNEALSWLEFLEGCQNQIDVQLIAANFKLSETQKIGFVMGRGNPDWKKGHDKIPGAGRPKGSVSKEKKQMLERIEFVLGLLDETIEKDIHALKPRERAELWKSLQEYIRPKLMRTEVKAEVTSGPKKIGFDESES